MRFLMEQEFEVALIGGSGFVAKHLIEVLKKMNLSFIVYSRNESEFISKEQFQHFDLLYSETPQPIRPVKVKTLIFNSVMKGRFLSESAEWSNQGAVTAPDFHLLSKKLNLKFNRLITMGSSEEYGARQNPTPILETDDLAAISSYGVWKKKLYENARLWAKTNAAQSIHLRPFIIYGEDSDPNMFIKQIISVLKNGEPFKMTPGEQYRSFVSIKTLEKTIQTLLLKSSWQEYSRANALNVSDPQYWKMKDVALLISELIPNSKIEVGALNYRTEEVWHQQPDLHLITKLLGNSYENDFKEDLKKLIS
ncbi:hypothetical protein CIK05_00175 [Bdellovibrio sp. qaytius]|nr:hypothetical protein CIK05_00175 [Bdellovibrio sp. qaytius]